MEDQGQKGPKAEEGGEAEERGKMPRLEPNADDDGDHEMQANAVERMFHVDMTWTLKSVEDMCETTHWQRLYVLRLGLVGRVRSQASQSRRAR